MSINSSLLTDESLIKKIEEHNLYAQSFSHGADFDYSSKACDVHGFFESPGTSTTANGHAFFKLPGTSMTTEQTPESIPKLIEKTMLF